MARYLIIPTILALSLTGLASAQQSVAWQDPTRPPMAVQNAEPGAESSNSGSPLQSIMRPKQGQPIAIIDGKAYRVGDMWGERKILRIHGTAVDLQGAEGITLLKMTPGVELKPIQPMPAKPKRGSSATTPRGAAASGHSDAPQSGMQ
ncbi:MAG: hypothetical protein FDZ72_07855 [Betaproteobacteria bacterium]|nr:MAG: hypothetical protein FDZ72_07855 [Betaproteobacteria bacterium]